MINTFIWKHVFAFIFGRRFLFRPFTGHVWLVTSSMFCCYGLVYTLSAALNRDPRVAETVASLMFVVVREKHRENTFANNKVLLSSFR